jgi:hypothetical protein
MLRSGISPDVPVPTGARAIPLTQGQVTWVSEEDYERVSQFKWCAAWGGKEHPKFIAITGGNKNRKVLHRFILGLVHSDELTADHINGNTLDNRRCNLRACTADQNKKNRPVSSLSTVGQKGVYHDKRDGRFYARIKANHKWHSLGGHSTAELAAAAYNEAAKVLHGEYAHLNEVTA